MNALPELRVLGALVGLMVAVGVPGPGELTAVPTARLAAVPGSGLGVLQEVPSLRVRTPDAERSVQLTTARGYAAFALPELGRLGWGVDQDRFGATLAGPGGEHVEVRADSPFVRWQSELVQLTDAPYFEAGTLWIPLQFLSDILPAYLSDRYSFDGATGTLDVVPSPGATPGPPSVPPPGPPSESGADSVPDPGSNAAPDTRSPMTSAPAGAEATEGAAQRPAPPDDGIRVVVIDAGHGGADPGSISRSGTREKTVALGIALSMAAALEEQPNLEVRLIRDDDTFVPLWDRGTIATEIKGDRPGVFVSVHANSFSSPARGFETYFLSEARTEHERRVAAIENAPVGHEERPGAAGEDLDFILRELKNLDTQHWSALLAEMVQEEVDEIHPGPNRGVKQGPLAVITNSLMPAVLVEIGYLSDRDEARLLARPGFQEDAGRAIAAAVVRFFERYPPGSGIGEGS